MTYQFTVSPDFGPDQLPDWHIFNTWLQRQLEISSHFESYDSFVAQRQAVSEGKVDIIYANPYDASYLVREQGFIALASGDKSDEAVIAVRSDSSTEEVEQLSDGCRIALTDDPDITLMGMIMLEPANLGKDNTVPIKVDNYVQIAKSIIKGKSDVGFFLSDVFDNFSNLVKSQLKLLVRSDIQVVRHVLLVGPKLADRNDELFERLATMKDNSQMKVFLEGLGFDGWKRLESEEVEYMIDLMDALDS